MAIAKANPLRTEASAVWKAIKAFGVIGASAFLAMLLFGGEYSGNRVVGWLVRRTQEITYFVGETNTLVAGVVFGMALLVGLAYWVRGK